MSATTQLFNTLADNYQAYRPTYSEAALQALASFAAPMSEGGIIDIGSGTGILLRQLLEAFGSGFSYTGIEPGRDMLAKAREFTPARLPIVYLEGTAEAVPLPDRSVALLTVAQALHWLDRPRFYAQAARLLADHGTLAIFYNQRDRADSFNAAYERFTGQYNARSESEAHSGKKRGGLGIVLLRNGTFAREIAALPAFGDPVEIHTPWDRMMTPDAFIGTCLSTVQFQNVIGVLGEDMALARLRRLMTDHVAGKDRFVIPYKTSLIMAKRI